MLLPDGQKATIIDIEDGYALLRRVEGSRAGILAVCHVSKLEPIDPRELLRQAICGHDQADEESREENG